MSERLLLRASFVNAVRYEVVGTAIGFACSVIMIPLIPIVLPIVWLRTTMVYRHIRCELWERSLKVHHGWLIKSEKTIPLEKITDLGVVQGPIMRWMDVEAIAVETAGQSGTGGPLVKLVGVRDARAFRDAVLEQRDRIMRGLHEDAAHAPGELPADAAMLTEIRDILLRIERTLGQSS